MDSDDAWPSKPYEPPKTWSREGVTFMNLYTIDNIVRNSGIDLNHFELSQHGLIWLTEVRDESGSRLHAMQGGIGAFIEDCRVLFSTLALAESDVLESKT